MTKLIKKVLLSISVISLIIPNIALSQDLTIVGTGSGSSILRAIGAEFTKKNPDIDIIIPKSIGSGGGIKAVNSEEYKLGRIAKTLKKDSNLKYVPFAKMPIVFFVNNSVPIKNITPKQICDIYSGEIKYWKDINKSAKGRIRVIRREDGDSSLNVLIGSLVGFKDITITKQSKITFSDPSTIDTAIGQKNSIAFGTWPNIKNKRGITSLSIDEINPTNNSYLYSGELALIYKEKNFNGSLKKFIQFLSTSTAKKIIVEAGGLPAH